MSADAGGGGLTARSSSEARPEILVVDDEPGLREMIEEYLGARGFAVRTADGGAAMRRRLADKPADLIVLDVNMPGEDGLSLARELRSRSQVAIVFLTAAGGVVDRVAGLEVGGDDYLPKPFDLRELLARIRSVLRRAPGGTAPAPAGRAPDAVSARRAPFGVCTLDLDARKLYARDGREVPLTAMEFDLLEAFARQPNRALGRERLLELAHKRGSEPFDRSIDIRVSRLRRKVEPDPGKPQVIKTVRGAGYMYVPGRAGDEP